MSAEFERLLSPIRIGPLSLRNRVVMGAMHTRLDEVADGTARLAEFYRARAAGGVALILTGGHAPNQDGRIDEESPVLDGSTPLEPHRALCEAVHAEGAHVVLQVLHAGRYARIPAPVAPSPVASPLGRTVPRELSTDEVWATVASFATTARRAAEAGYDGVEIMGSEGYLINQFTAVRTNRRTDEFGGDLDGRLALPVAIVRAVRKALGRERAVIYRISALDLVEGGMTPDEVGVLARAVEAAGADALNTGVGWHESRVPTVSAAVPRAMWASASRMLTELVDVPVIASNRINTPAVAEQILAAGDADLVSLARPLLADPRFVEKASAGLADHINTCIACNQSCLDRVLLGRTATCLVNPVAGREVEFRRPRTTPRRVCVVGAGPAGLACAVTAAERGHEVIVLESAEAAGGQITMAMKIPGKAEFGELLRYFRHRIAALGIDVRYGTPATAEAVVALGCDEVVVATGVVPRMPAISGIEHPSVVTYVDVLRHGVEVGSNVAVIGAGGIGVDVAEFLVADPAESIEPESFRRAWGVSGPAPAERTDKRHVVLMQRSGGRVGTGPGRSTGWIHRSVLAREGVEMLGGVDYVHIDDDGLHVLVDGNERTIDAETIVVCAGQESLRTLADELSEIGITARLIGGARQAGEVDCARAIEEATELAWSF